MKCKMRGCWGDMWWGGGVWVEGECLIMHPGGTVLREINRDMYIAVELNSRPTIRVVSHL